MKLAKGEIVKFYDQYKADQQDGFVSNIDIYVERMLIGLSKKEIKEIKDELKKTISNDIK